MTVLIFFRAVQGFVAGPMIPLSQSLLLTSYPRSKAGTAMAAWSMTTLIAPVVGPLLGGWITDNISWPWIFYINVPVGILAALATWAIYHKRESTRKSLPIDKIGLALLVIWVGAMQIMLDIGKEFDWFESKLVVALAATAVVGFAFFLAWELTDEHPVVELRLFARRNFWAGTLATALGYALFFGSLVLLPLWLQQFMGYTASDAGEVLAPVGLFAMLLSPLVGKNVNKVDPRKLATFAFAVFAIVMWMRAGFATSADYRVIVIPTIVQGVAVAFFFIPLVTITLSGLPPDKIPAASGLSNFARITAGAFGTSISTTLWENRAILHHTQLAESVNPSNPAAQATISGLQSGGFSMQEALAQINRLVDQQAFTMAATDLFWLAAVMFVVLIPVIWLSHPQAGAGGADAAAGAH
jgi:DHA2 family multidrug resistance protein